MRSFGSVNQKSERNVVVRVAGGASVVLLAVGAALAQEDISEIPFESVPGDTTLVGGSNPIVLDSNVQVTGTVSHEGVYQLGSNTPTTYDISVQRYIVDAAPANVGVVVPLDQNLMVGLCRDKDGCDVTLAMINWDGTSNAASAVLHLFLSEANARWRFSDDAGSPSGLDGDNVTAEILLYDCYLTDAELSLGSANQRQDAVLGFGLLNCSGCAYSDVTTTCRVVISD